MPEVVVGLVRQAHGLRGEVAVEVRSDWPQRRFAPGAVLSLDPGPGELTVASHRWHRERLLVAFEQIGDRDAAAALAGRRLVVNLDPNESTGDPEEFFDHQLVGLRAQSVAGADLGPVTGVVHLPGQDLLALATVRGERLVPFVAALVPEVDLARGRVVIAPPAGLLDEAEAATEA
ncbi:MAG: ribosome maturation factor RimM [Propionibacteriaceae bacterium]|nr:ribosome maturation factor RimM [Propionibacteriaceae bacterium]